MANRPFSDDDYNTFNEVTNSLIDGYLNSGTSIARDTNLMADKVLNRVMEILDLRLLSLKNDLRKELLREIRKPSIY